MRSAARGWPGFVAERAVRCAVLVPLVVFAAFVLVANAPTDPVTAFVGTDMLRVSPEQRAAIAERWGLDQPVLVRFGIWASHALGGDFGTSMIYQAPVAEVISARFLASLALMAAAWVLSGMIGFTLGLLAAAYEGTVLDRAIRAYALVLASAPTAWVAIVGLFVFSVALGWTPVCCAAPPGLLPSEVTLLDRLNHLALPVATLSVLGVAQVTLHTRAKVIEVIRSDVGLLARAQGASRLDVALAHGVRNGAMPALTLQFAHVGELFGGSILAETVFSYPGLGQATVEAGLRGDAPLLLGIAVVAALFVFAGNTIADALHRVLDPRLMRKGQAP